MTLREFLRKTGKSTVDEAFYTQIRRWGEWYHGDVKDFHHYTVYNGSKDIPCKRDTLNMAKHVCEDWASLLMNEKVEIVLNGPREQEFLDQVFKENRFWVKANELQELKAAYGTVAYLPYADGVTVDMKTGKVESSGSIRINYITAENIFPLSWDGAAIHECAFSSSYTINGNDYLYLQQHLLEEGEYVIQNNLFKSMNGQLSPVPLPSVEKFAQIPEKVYTHSPHRQFVIDRLAIANNVDTTCPMGISVFANAIDVLCGVDKIYDSYNNEFVLGKKRVMVKDEALRSEATGKLVYDPNDVVFHMLPGGLGDEQFIHEIDMTLRAEEHETALQNRLNLLSYACGFGENHYRFGSGGISTATQVISENSALFRKLRQHEIILEEALKELVYAILFMGRNVLGQDLDPDVEVTVDFDDSIIEDESTSFDRDSRMVAMGIMRADEFRAKWMHEDLSEARQSLPGLDETMELEGQEE